MTTAFVVLLSFIFGFVSFFQVLNRKSDTNGSRDVISEYLNNSARIKEISLPKSESALAVQEVSYDFDGYVFRVLTSESARGHVGNSNILSEDLFSDVLNATAFARNSFVADKLNIEIREVLAEEIGADVRKSVLSFDDTFDILSFTANTEMSLQLQVGALVDLKKIKTLDLNSSWYDSSCVRDLVISDKLFVLTGDIIAGNDDAVSAMVYNRDLAQQLGYYEDMEYTFNNNVASGTWTLDTLNTITLQVNDSITDENPEFGAFYKSGMDTFPLCIGAGASSSERDSGGVPNINLNSDKFLKVFNKVLSLQMSPASNSNITADSFAKGKTLFDTIMLRDLEKLSQSGVNYGILPMPKYDEAQSEYRSLVNLKEAVCIAVPTTNKELDRTGVIIEQLSSESSWYMWESYYENIVNHSQDSVDMIKIILSNKYFDLGDLFGWAFISKTLDELTATDGMKNFYDEMTKRSNAAQFAMSLIIKDIDKAG